MLPIALERSIYGLITTPVLHLALEHGIFDRLLADGPLPSSSVAERIGADADTVERLLLVLAAFEVVRRDADGSFHVPVEIAPFVARDSASYVGGFVNHMVMDAPGRLERLAEYLTRGKEAADAARPAPYDEFYRDEQSTQDFMDAMWDLSYGVSQELAALAGLDGHRRLVDVGGANGPFAVAALRQSPELRAVVFDLAQVGPHLERTRVEHGLADRLSFVAGDFFHDDLPAGDLIAMGYVMSNWPDRECLELLRKAHAACVPGGRLLIMERLFDDGRDGPIATAVMNLEMQVETRGRHRTPAEYVELLTSAGFVDPEVRRSTRDKHLVIGCKPSG
ncbi:MAG: hydroxyneurosporene methyltransferase [Solirubrobacterales bacterium]|nr:hydroxyneurosporene methyltransferase [Solirubrobacterales bacterium]